MSIKNGIFYLTREEIKAVFKKIREEHGISKPYKIYGDPRFSFHPSSIDGKNLKYYVLQAKSEKHFKKFKKHLDKVLNTFGHSAKVIFEGYGDDQEYYFSIQIYAHNHTGVQK